MSNITRTAGLSLIIIALFTANAVADRSDKYDKNGEYSGHSDDDYKKHGDRQKHKSRKGAMDINLAALPTSINGTYEIDRFVIKEGDKIVLDSKNDFAVADDKGFLTINMNIGKDITLEMAYNIQMVGPAFQNPELKKYEFVYDKKTFTIPYTQGKPISEALSSIGMTVYDHEDVYWELPFENNKKLFLKIEKESDNIMLLTNKPYYNIQ